MTYQRVIPRDLFNEAKLLKCLGQLSLIIHDGIDKDRWSVPAGLKLEHVPGIQCHGFHIVQDENDGSLSCSNLDLTMDGDRINLSTPYNSRESYPLQFFFEAGGFDYIEGPVFNDEGKISAEFTELLDYIEGH